MASSYSTRAPSGKPSWPILLLAGAEKAGKTYAAAQASASDLIGRTLWVTVGEDQPDEYGALPGARFEIVEHDGTYRGILGALTWAAAQPPVDGKPNLIVLDSAGRCWTLLSDMAQATANERAARRNKAVGDAGADITMDLWNTAKQRWGHILDTLRGHQGPSIVTARLEQVTAMENGQPTKDKTWKIQAEKNLAFEVGAIVQMRAFGENYLTGVRSLRYRRSPSDLDRLPDDFTVDQLWRNLGLAEDTPGARDHVAPVAQGAAEERNGLLNAIAAAAGAAGVTRQQIADDWAHTHDGEPINQTSDLGGLEVVLEDLRRQAQTPARTPDATTQEQA